MASLKPGKNISKSSLKNKRPTDPIDVLIHTHRLRIKDVYLDKSLDLLLLVLNNGQVIRSGIEEHARLRGATQSRLEKWQLIAGGTGLTWPELDEDLSLRGFIHSSSVDQAVRSLAESKPKVLQARKHQARKA